MSRVAKAPISFPSGIDIKTTEFEVNVKGPKGALSIRKDKNIAVKVDKNMVTIEPKKQNTQLWALAGTTRALLINLIIGVTKGFEKKLELVGVGYRAQIKGNVISLLLGYSHPIDYKLPDGITAETPSNTVIVLKSIDKHLLGQTAAEIRAFREPEPYKGKGVRYENEQIKRKETKKK